VCRHAGQGIIRRSTSAFSSLVLLVKKVDSTCRFYRALNANTVKDAYPIPVVDELLDELFHACFFTKLDLCSRYHQVWMNATDIAKIAFRTQTASTSSWSCFRLCNASVTFQALMNDVLTPSATPALRPRLLQRHTNSWAAHLQHIRTVLDLLQQHRLFVKRSKCEFGATSITYLAHVISVDGVTLDPTTVQAIAEWPQPRSARAVCGFLGLAGNYCKFVKEFSMVAAPLTAPLRKEGFSWNDEAAAAFAALKNAVTTAPILTLSDFNQPSQLFCRDNTRWRSSVDLRTRAHRPRRRHPPLAPIPLGPPLLGEDESLQPQVPPRPTLGYDPTTPLGG